MGHLRLVHSAPLPQAPGFSARDLMALSSWVARSEQHGYCRIHVEGGDGMPGSDSAAYALVYELGQDWASWGLARAGDRISIWHCGTGADMCSFPEMSQALGSLPPVGFSTPKNLRRPARECVAAIPLRPRLSLVHQA
jgi:hypothetical protein